MLSHPLCYLNRTLFKTRKLWILKIFSLRPTLPARRCLGSLRVPEPSPLQKVSGGVGDRFILTDIVIRFESSQLPLFLEITTVASGKCRLLNQKKTEKGVDLFIKYLLRLILSGLLVPRRDLSLILK